MNYQEFSFESFYNQFDTEEKAINFVWQWKLNGAKLVCVCGRDSFYQHKSRPEVRECAKCGKQQRVRPGTIFQNSKLSLRKWLGGIFFMMSSKRGVSALELKKHLDIGSYGTAWRMLQKIRHALIDRDGIYKLSELVEVDSSQFGSKKSGTAKEVIIGVESKEWIDESGNKKSKAGFAQIMVGSENKENAKKFIEEKLSSEAVLIVDGAKCYEIKEDLNVSILSQITSGNKQILSQWHRWMHRFVTNAKIWILGTHHGISSKYLMNYLGEYAYRFNRRHDTGRLFTRALRACLKSSPRTAVQIATLTPAFSG